MLSNLIMDSMDSRETLEEKLREQFVLRAPKLNPFGLDDTPRPWGELGLGDKVEALYQVCEWQWSNPQKFRALINDDEPTSWRVDPVGWDKVGNQYWLFDDNRLWVQHPAPKPPKPPPQPKQPKQPKTKATKATNKSATKTIKAKQSKIKKTESQRVKRAESPSLEAIQQLLAEERGLRSTRKRGREAPLVTEDSTTPSKRLRDRSGKAAPIYNQAAAFAAALKPSNQPSRGATRSSRRTRANGHLDEPVEEQPRSYPTTSKQKAAGSRTIVRRRTGLESDGEDSELSDLSSEEDEDVEVNESESIEADIGDHADMDDVHPSTVEVPETKDKTTVNGSVQDRSVEPQEEAAQSEPAESKVEFEQPEDSNVDVDMEAEQLTEGTDTRDAPANSEKIDQSTETLDKQVDTPKSEELQVKVDKQVDAPKSEELQVKVDGDTQSPPKEEAVAIPTESKTVLQEVAEEVKEAQIEEEEADPDNEVLFAAKKARKPGFLEWECVSLLVSLR